MVSRSLIPDAGHLPAALGSAVKTILGDLGDHTPILSARPVPGGCINHAHQIKTGRSAYLLKWNNAAPPGLFTSEAKGLARLAATHTVRVPVVHAAAETNGPCPAFILLEYLTSDRSPDWGQLGEQLAELHYQGLSPQNPPAYGLDEDNYLGSTHQQGGWEVDWVNFFGSSRLRPQMMLAQVNGRLPSPRARRLEHLIDHLPALLGDIVRRPALIHGDLWSGNVIPGPGGFCLIDPAISYSDREAEIAYTQLFGGFDPRFYSAYQSTWPLEPGYIERRDIYNLYHLLNHLNLFGEDYGPDVDRILSRY